MNWIAKHWDLFMGQRVPFSSTQGYVFFINIHGGKISSDLPIARGFNKMASKCSFQPKLACDSIHSYKPNLIPFSCLSGDTHRMGKLPRLFLRTHTLTKDTQCIVWFLKGSVKAASWFCLGWRPHGWSTHCGMWDCLLQELVSHLVLSSCLYQGTKMIFKNFSALFTYALLPGGKQAEKTPEDWQSTGMSFNLIHRFPVRPWTVV